jgi:hypothetical protein
VIWHVPLRSLPYGTTLGGGSHTDHVSPNPRPLASPSLSNSAV